MTEEERIAFRKQLRETYTQGPLKDKDLQYGFDGYDRDGRLWYGKNIRIETGPTPMSVYHYSVYTEHNIKEPLEQMFSAGNFN